MATATTPDINPRAELSDLELFQLAQADGARTILHCLDGLPWFQNAPDWTAWRAFLCAAYGLPMTAEEFAIYRRCTGRQSRPVTQAREVWMVCGRRARKSAIAALMAVWAGLKDYSQCLAPGERPWIPILAKNKDDAQQIKRFAESILADWAWSVRSKPTAEEIGLASDVDLVIRAAKITAGRSRACPLAVLDEVAFFPTDEAADPDQAIIRGIRPGMATIPGAMLVGLSSPYARRGALYEAHRDHWGKDGDPVLVWQADTLTMHDTPQVRTEVEAEYVKDPENARAEYGAQFRSDVVAYMSEELLDVCTVKDRVSQAPISVDDIHAGKAKACLYLAFVDVSGGLSDAFALAIGHWDQREGKAVLDSLHEWRAPFNTETVTAEAVAILKAYGVKHVKGDKYAGNWPRDRFAAHEIGYVVSEDDKNTIYRDALPAFTSRRVELLDDARLRAQLLGLDRKVTSGGREIITHRPGGHDDVANAATGAILEAYRIGKHYEAEAPKKRPKTLLELRAMQAEEDWNKLFEPEKRLPDRYQGGW